MSYIEIAVPIVSADESMFHDVIRQGIDGHLEAFCKSVFKYTKTHLVMNFHKEELHILLRRLQELQEEDWVNDIIEYTGNK